MTKKEKINSSVGWKVAVAFMLETTREGYNRLRQVVLDTFKLAKHDFLTFYYITKYRPKVYHDLFEVDPLYTTLA